MIGSNELPSSCLESLWLLDKMGGMDHGMNGLVVVVVVVGIALNSSNQIIIFGKKIHYLLSSFSLMSFLKCLKIKC